MPCAEIELLVKKVMNCAAAVRHYLVTQVLDLARDG